MIEFMAKILCGVFGRHFYQWGDGYSLRCEYCGRKHD